MKISADPTVSGVAEVAFTLPVGAATDTLDYGSSLQAATRGHRALRTLAVHRLDPAVRTGYPQGAGRCCRSPAVGLGQSRLG